MGTYREVGEDISVILYVGKNTKNLFLTSFNFIVHHVQENYLKLLMIHI